MGLEEVKEGNEDLYEILGFNISTVEELHAITLSVLSKQFRKVSLELHPDKQISNEGGKSLEKWHDLQRAYELLQNHKVEYDNWYKDHFLRIDRNLIHELEKRENQNIKKSNNESLISYLEYGEHLRKVLHFRKTINDWKEPSIESTNPSSSYPETCLLRVCLEKKSQFEDEKRLNKWFSEIGLDLKVSYYSSRNRTRDSELVVYAQASSVETTLNIIQRATNHIHPDILEINSATEFEYFQFTERVDLDPDIAGILLNSIAHPIHLD